MKCGSLRNLSCMSGHYCYAHISLKEFDHTSCYISSRLMAPAERMLSIIQTIKSGWKFFEKREKKNNRTKHDKWVLQYKKFRDKTGIKWSIFYANCEPLLTCRWMANTSTNRHVQGNKTVNLIKMWIRKKKKNKHFL